MKYYFKNMNELNMKIEFIVECALNEPADESLT